MLILSINSSLKILPLLLGFLSVVLGLLILADLVSRAPCSSHVSARPKTYLKPTCLHHGPTIGSKKWVRP